MGRESRILDAAGELLLAHGYRRVTIDDVAVRAGVGKGTVYLHWSSKLELFATVLVRDATALTRDLLAALRADPGEVLLHRSLRTTYLMVMRRPLARAFYTGDTALLGAVATDSKIGLQVTADKSGFTPTHLRVLYDHGLLADDPAADHDLAFRLSAATTGFFVADRLIPLAGEVDPDDALERKADALATVVRRAFEPPGEPSPDALHAAAPVVAGLYDRLLTEFTHHLPEEEP